MAHLFDETTSYNNCSSTSTDSDTRCGTRLLSLVARGHVILSELSKLARLVPEPFNVTTGGSGTCVATTKELESLLHHFGYFKEAESFEARIEADPNLKEADERLYNAHFNEIQRFYLTFESIQKYADDLNKLAGELEDETGQSFVRLIQDKLVCRLLCEAYFLLGYSLLTVDRQFEGTLRETILISYYRYSASKSSPSSLLDSTCNLVRTTGYRCAQQQQPRDQRDAHYYRPPDYPESLLKRLNVDTGVIELLVAKLVNADLYNQTSHSFPHPEHRSCALTQQASIIHVLLYFTPSILNNEKGLMREITNRFFYDYWVLNLYLGDLINLFEEWQPYAAAREACAQMSESRGLFERLAKQNRLKFDATQANIVCYLGWMDKSAVLQHHTKMLDCIREANMLLRWFLLQSQSPTDWLGSTSKAAHSIVMRYLPSRANLYDFLQSLADLEGKFAQIYDSILANQEASIRELRSESVSLLEELISIFNNSKPVLWVQTGGNSKLSSLLSDLKLFIQQDVAILDNSMNARDLFFKAIKKLDSYRDTYTDGKSLQVNQLFSVIRDSMNHIVKLLGLPRNMKFILSSVGDFSYAWRLMDSTFTNQMQELIRNNPLRLRAIESTFNKIFTILNRFSIPLEYSQLDSSRREQLKGVTLYYSDKLVKFIRHVLQVFPETILQLIARVGELQRQITSKESYESFSKLSLDNLKESSSFEDRKEILNLTYKISQYAESMLSMQYTMVGQVSLNPHQLLKDGIREELSKKISHLIIETFVSTSHNSNRHSIGVVAQHFLNKLELLHENLNNYTGSLEYIQEYLSIHGLRTWNEELSRIINGELKQVQRALLHLEPDEKDSASSVYENMLTRLLRNEELKSNIMVKLLQDLLHLTDPRSTIYDEQMNAWYLQTPTKAIVVDLNVFEALSSALGPSGLGAIDEVCCMMLKKELESIGRLLLSIVSNNNKSVLEILDQLHGLETVNSREQISRQSRKKIFASMLAKVAPYGVKLINHLLSIGQLQAIRMNISLTLSCLSHHEARSVYSCLERLDGCLLSAISNTGGGCDLSSQQTASSSSGGSSLLSNDDLGNNSFQEDGDGAAEQEELLTRQEVARTANYWHEMDEHNSLLLMLLGAFERVGLSDPISRLYTSALAGCDNRGSSAALEREHLRGVVEMIFLILLNQCSKFKFSLEMSGFVPRESKSLFYESASNVDAQPLFYGLTTLINHLQPYIFVDIYQEDSRAVQFDPLLRMLKLGSMYVTSMINDRSDSVFSARPQNLTLEVVNMILAMIELLRLSQQSHRYLLSNSHLPEFVFETFQFIVFHLSSSTNKTIHHQ